MKESMLDHGWRIPRWKKYGSGSLGGFTKEMNKAIFICDFRSVPGERECLVAIWSQGEECKKCDNGCYRNGWNQKMVKQNNSLEVLKRKEGG